MQYEQQFIEALQFMWGTGFLSPGGPEEVRAMLADISLVGRKVLDIGSGLGGVDLLLAREHGASEVIGIDVESQLIAAARDNIASEGLQNRVNFQLVEPGPLPFADETFDVVFSKDAMVHISDKTQLFTEVLRVLRPEGVFTAADWLWADGAAESPIVKAWLSGGPLKFAFTTVQEAEAALKATGYTAIAIDDRRALLQESNQKEVAALAGSAGRQLAERVGEEMANARLRSARGRQGALDAGQLIPCHLRARKLPRGQKNH
jgi:ubiquinone/menaquinone biosynthesis C-methylase UbiE